MFGTTQLYVYVDHTKHKPGELPEYTDAMEEMATSAGFDTSDEEKSPGDKNMLADDCIMAVSMIDWRVTVWWNSSNSFLMSVKLRPFMMMTNPQQITIALENHLS